MIITGATTVVASKDQVSCDLAGEAAILSLKNGVYYGLNPLGARIWNLIQEPRRLAELRDILLSEYDVEAERCERDVIKVLHRLAAEGLIDIKHETAA